MENILDDQFFEEPEEIVYAEAEKSKRFANYLLDTIGYYVFALIIGFFLGLLELALDTTIISFEDNPLIDYVFGFLIILIYFSISEFYLNGKSPAKYLTKTRVVSLDGTSLTFKQILGRSFSRLIPFEPFSFLGDGKGWHDSISQTMVVDERRPL